MLKIQQPSDGVFSLSGRIQMEDVPELRRLLGLESKDRTIALDLGEVTLIDRDAVKFLAQCEMNQVKLENCPGYIREWIDGDRNRTQNT